MASPPPASMKPWMDDVGEVGKPPITSGNKPCLRFRSRQVCRESLQGRGHVPQSITALEVATIPAGQSIGPLGNEEGRCREPRSQPGENSGTETGDQACRLPSS